MKTAVNMVGLAIVLTIYVGKLVLVEWLSRQFRWSAHANPVGPQKKP
jgi:hypothetical protein